MTNHNKLLLALVFGSMSYSATAKVYSWRGEDGAMHYSQFPRELVEKNNAQSRESRRIEDLADVVDDLDDQNDTNLLDGLDDIVANASAVREKDKVLKRTSPEVILAAQATALEQQALLEKKSTQRPQTGVEESVYTAAKTKSAKQNPFLANIHKRLNKFTADRSLDAPNNVKPEPTETVAITQTVKTERVSARVKPQNRFLAGIKNKLNGRPMVSFQNDVVAKSQEPAPQKPQTTTATALPDKTQSTHVHNRFLADIEGKRNRHIASSHPSDSVTASAGALSVQNSNEPLTRVVSTGSEKEQVQNKFLAEINKRLFKARLANSTEVVSAPKKPQKAGDTKANVGRDLSLSADKIKTIEKQVETKAADVKPELPRKSSSALMLSRLSSSHVGRLSLRATGTDQLDRQGIDSVNKFVNDINRAAEK